MTENYKHLADEIERDGIERVIYGKGHADLLMLNNILVTALRSALPICGENSAAQN
jgi:hypothetical protein